MCAVLAGEFKGLNQTFQHRVAPAAQYRVTISYDSSKYYLYGLLKVEGIG